MARPEKPIDWELVDRLLMAGCKGTEIAPHFDIHPDTFYRKVEEEYNVGFTEYCFTKRSKGDSLIRLKQFEHALEKDNGMLIWLGKQRLDQKEPGSNNKSFTDVAAHLQEMIAFFDRVGLMQTSSKEVCEASHNKLAIAETDPS